MTDGIRFLTDEEAREHYDQQCRRLLGIDAEEFLRRYDAGEYDDPDGPDGFKLEVANKVIRLAMLRPFWD